MHPATFLQHRLGWSGGGGDLSMRANSVALVLAVLSANALGQLTWIVAARMTSPGEVGLASGVIAAMVLCGQVALMGLGSAVIALLPLYREQPLGLLRVVFGTAASAGLVLAGCFMWLASRVFHQLSVVVSSPEYALAFLAMGVLWTIFLLLEPTSISLRRGDQVLVRNTIAGMLRVVVLLCTAAILGVTTSFGIFFAWLASILAGCALGYTQLGRTTLGTRSDRPVDPGLLRRALSVGLPNYALDLAFMTPGLVLPILVTEMLSPAQNAYWYISWALAGLVFLGPHYAAVALFAESAHRPHTLAAGARQSIAVAMCLGIPAAVLISFAVPWVLPVLGTSYGIEGTVPLRVLAWAVVPLAVFEVYMTACRLRRRLAEATLVCAAIGLVALVGAAVTGPRFGLVGVAGSWLAAQTLAGVWSAWRLPQVVR